jgi:hypothetical protein
MAKRKPLDFDAVPRMSRQDAFDAGEQYYFTAEPCQKGHVAPRFSRSGHCVVCRREYWRDWMNAKREAEGDEYRTKVRMQNAKDPIANMFRIVRSRAGAKGLEFSITRDDINIPENCPCCSRKIEHRTGEFKKGPQASSPSLDRIDSNFGYVNGNVEVLCWRCNMLKNNATADELRTILRWLEKIENKPLRLVV